MLNNPNLSPLSHFNKSAIEHILGLPFSNDNKVRLLESGQQTFDAIIDALTSAREIICIEFYIFRDDATGKKIAEILKKKAAQGVQIYLLYDHFGSFLTAHRFWSDLKKAGIKIRVSQPFRFSAPRGYLYRNHKKLLIIDNQKAFTGGFNIADEYRGYFIKKEKKIWRDVGIHLEGPIVSTLFEIFRKSWKTWKGDTITGSPENDIPPFDNGLPVIPIFVSSRRSRRRMRNLLLYSIKNAQNSIYITTAYFTPSRKILRALEIAAQNGITVLLLLPGKSDVSSFFYAGRAHYRKLLKAGVEIFNYNESVLHSKTSVFDGYWSIIGSTNLDVQSLRRNEESNVGIADIPFANQMINMFQSDLKKSIRINADTWSKRPWHEKLLERFYSFIVKKL